MRRQKMDYQIAPLGDSAVILEFGEEINGEIQQKVQMLASFLEAHPPEWMIEYIPAFTTVALFYNPLHSSFHSLSNQTATPYEIVCKQLKALLTDLKSGDIPEPRTVEIPVCYGGEFGPDLSEVASLNNLTEEEVIHYHTNGKYLVHMIGFAPGFPYIGGMPVEIAAPRKKSPRTRIPAGSVGIAGTQTGVYPIETPGGWQLIGKTPLALFRPGREYPALLQAGDHIRFKAITPEAFNEWKEEIE
jgi:inhibitor of KinA